MSRGSEDESLTANTEHTAFLCLCYHIPQIKSTDFKKNIKRCNATPPRAPFSASGEPTGSSSARQGRQCKKMSRHKRLPNAGNQPNPLKGSPRLGFDVNASREPPGPSSARQGRHIQKNEQAQATPQCREYFGGGAASCHCFAMGRTAGFDALKERQHKNST